MSGPLSHDGLETPKQDGHAIMAVLPVDATVGDALGPGAFEGRRGGLVDRVAAVVAFLLG